MGRDSCYVKISDAYLSASVEWDSSYYVTVNVTSNGSWRFKKQGTPGDTNNIFAQYGNLINGGFQGSLNTTYVFQMHDGSEETWFEDSFTVTSDSGGGGGDSGGGDSGDDEGGAAIRLVCYYSDTKSTVFSLDYVYSGSSFEVVDGSSITKPSSSSRTNYAITGDANGGTFSEGEITASITAIKTITTNYSFLNWNTDKSGAGSTYWAGHSYTMPDDNVYLYPIFSSSSSSTSYSDNSLSRLPIPSNTSSRTAALTATFNANGGTVTPASQSVDTTVTKTFGGWMNSSGTEVTSLDSEGTVYAKWNDSYSNASVFLPQADKEGYRLIGWSTSTSGTNLQQPGAYVSISGDTTFYAIWTKKETPKGGVFIHDGTKWQLVSS